VNFDLRDLQPRRSVAETSGVIFRVLQSRKSCLLRQLDPEDAGRALLPDFSNCSPVDMA